MNLPIDRRKADGSDSRRTELPKSLTLKTCHRPRRSREGNIFAVEVAPQGSRRRLNLTGETIESYMTRAGTTGRGVMEMVRKSANRTMFAGSTTMRLALAEKGCPDEGTHEASIWTFHSMVHGKCPVKAESLKKIRTTELKIDSNGREKVIQDHKGVGKSGPVRPSYSS